MIKHLYSFFSGTIIDILEKDLHFFDKSYALLEKMPKKNCKICYGRYYTGRDLNNFYYHPCNCVVKVAKKNFDNLK